MREFFKSELETLYAKTQLRQYETLSAMVDAEGKPDGIRQIRVMIDTCVMVCDQYPYIPDEEKKKIVQSEMLRDPEFKGFNGQILHKWFGAKKDVYWAQYQTRVEKQAQTSPVTFDELPEALQKEIEAFKASLVDGAGLRSVPSVTREEIEAIQHEDQVSRGQAVGKNYQKREEELRIRERREKVIKERGLDKLQLHELKKFDVDGIDIWARNKEEAQELYIEIYINE